MQYETPNRVARRPASDPLQYGKSRTFSSMKDVEKEQRTTYGRSLHSDKQSSKMPNEIRDIATVDSDGFPYIFEKNVTIPR